VRQVTDCLYPYCAKAPVISRSIAADGFAYCVNLSILDAGSQYGNYRTGMKYTSTGIKAPLTFTVALINVICVLFVKHVYETVFMVKEHENELLR
jgi:hypothetical protein